MRVEKFYEAYAKRKAIEDVKLRQNAMIGAIYANTNFDSEENSGKREQILSRLEEQLNDFTYTLYNGARKKTEEEEQVEESPFFTVGRQALVDNGILDE